MIEPYWSDVAGPPRGPGTALRAVGVASLRAAWRVRVRGRENVPTSGPVILASNHTSVLDGPLLVAMTGRRVNALIKQEMFDGILGAGFRALGQIPVNRDVYDPAAVKASLAVLERGDVLAVYPEGTRGDGQFDTIKPGVAYFALCTGAPIVPVATLGSRDLSQPRESAAPLRSRIDIVFGPPIATESVGFPRRQLAVRAYAADLHARLREHVLRAQEMTERMPAPHERLQFGG
jgi:1-acyl-sn-glycerol-3-phosphate acyltransferase